ncbi:jmjC domain-containing protein 8 isoform X2 [Anolis sagrei]|uniref:jmjC domain-containing protein 8 isoform X2 n=1 Tax=Anolis sagrei TaxID=38937 RepID=UPI00352234B1
MGLPLGLVFFLLFLLPGESLRKDGGWPTNRRTALTEEESCTIERRDASLTYAEFIQQYAFSRPVILQGITDNSEFQAHCTKEELLAKFGDHHIRLSTANTYSYQKVDLLFLEYVDQLLEPQDLDSLGSETLYFFGDNNFTEWGSLFRSYTPPPFRIPGTTGAYSFGIAGSGSGVPFHWHGPGFSEVIFGRKQTRQHGGDDLQASTLQPGVLLQLGLIWGESQSPLHRWFLYPPEKMPEFHPNRTTLSWLLDTYPFLPSWERPMECTIHPGEVLYFPDRWWHATLNLDTSVFISTFLG